jgi:hypothetical protein
MSRRRRINRSGAQKIARALWAGWRPSFGIGLKDYLSSRSKRRGRP